MNGLNQIIKSYLTEKALLILSAGIISASGCSDYASLCGKDKDCPGGAGQQYCMLDNTCFGPGKSCGKDTDCPNVEYPEYCENGYCTYNGKKSCGGNDIDCKSGEICEKYFCIKSNLTAIEEFITPAAAIDGIIRYAKAGDLEKVRLCFDASASDAKDLTAANVQNIADVLGNAQLQQSLNLGYDSKVVQQEYKTPQGEEFFIMLYHENNGWKIHDL